MARKETSRRDSKTLSAILILGAVLASCSPEVRAQENQPDVSQVAPDSSDIIESATPQFTPTVEATPTQEVTATPEIIAMPEFENMHDYCIYRAKQVGIDLENLDNSNNLWLTRHPYRENLQNNFESNFQNSNNNVFLIVVGAGNTNGRAEYDNMVITSGGHKVILWAEAVMVRADGQAQMVLLPITIENTQNGALWRKYPWTTRPTWEGEFISEGYKNIIVNMIDQHADPESFVAWRSLASTAHFILSVMPGTIINLAPEYPSTRVHPELYNNDGMIEEPDFDQAAWSRFINTGDPSGLSYWTEVDGFELPFVFPYLTWHSENNLKNYGNENFVADFLKWREEFTLPDSPLYRSPLSQNWSPLP